MRFPYKKFHVSSRPGSRLVSVCRPVIPIHVCCGRLRVAYEALLDSGADFSIFHAEIGEAIGLDVRRGSPITFAGVGGATCRGFRHPVSLALGAWSGRCGVVFAYGLNMPYGILGQAEIFNRFHIAFSRRDGWVELRSRWRWRVDDVSGVTAGGWTKRRSWRPRSRRRASRKGRVTSRAATKPKESRRARLK